MEILLLIIVLNVLFHKGYLEKATEEEKYKHADIQHYDVLIG